jgi:hypothetical protein
MKNFDGKEVVSLLRFESDRLAIESQGSRLAERGSAAGAVVSPRRVSKDAPRIATG